MNITIPVSIKHPDRIVPSPFGDNVVEGPVEHVIATLEIDESTADAIKELLK